MAIEKKVQFVLSGKDETGAAIISVKEGLDDAAREAEKASRQMIVAAKAFGIETAAEAQRMKDQYATAFMRMQQDGKASAAEIAAAQMKMNQIASASTVSEIKKIASAHKEVEGGIIAGNGAIAASFGAIQAAMLPIIATIGSLSGAWNLAKMAADVQSQEQILANLGVQYGMTANQIVDAMKEASGGVLSTVDTIDVATRGLVSGLNVDQLVQVAGMAASIADATGKADAEVIGILEKTIATGEARGLKTLTLSADFKKAHEEYAKSIHKTVDALTLQERQAANMIAVQEMYNKQIKDTEYSLTFANDSMKRINNQMQDVGIVLGKLAYTVGAVAVAMVQSFIGAVEGYFAMILERATTMVEGLASLAKKLPGGQLFGEMAHSMRTMTEVMKDAQTQSNEYAQEAFRLTASLWNETKGHADNRKAIEDEVAAKAESAKKEQAIMDANAAHIVSVTADYLHAMESTMSEEEKQAAKREELYNKLGTIYDADTAKKLANDLAQAQSAQKLNNDLKTVATSMYNTFQQQYAATKSIGAAMEAAVKQAVAARINAYGAEAAVSAGMEFAAAWASLAGYQPLAAAQHTAAGIGYLGVAAAAGVAASVVSGGGGSSSGASAGATGGASISGGGTAQTQQQQETSHTIVIDSGGQEFLHRNTIDKIFDEINKAAKERGRRFDKVIFQ